VKAVTEHERDLERIANFSMMDDDFFTACLDENIECTELVLSIILKRNDLRVTKTKAQYFIKNLQGRSVRLDVFAKDAQGKEYNIEMQQSGSGAVPQRARYNSSVLDANISEPGENYDQLPDTYVIFITATDVLHGNRSIYHIERHIEEKGVRFDDGSHILYVNGSMQDETPLGKLMFDLHCKDPNQMHYPALATRSRYFKEDEEGVRKMCKAMEEMRAEVDTKARAEESARIVFNMLDKKLTPEVIADLTGISLTIVQELERKRNSTDLPN
jgi:hypothetical protein